MGFFFSFSERANWGMGSGREPEGDGADEFGGNGCAVKTPRRMESRLGWRSRLPIRRRWRLSDPRCECGNGDVRV